MSLVKGTAAWGTMKKAKMLPSGLPRGALQMRLLGTGGSSARGLVTKCSGLNSDPFIYCLAVLLLNTSSNSLPLIPSGSFKPQAVLKDPEEDHPAPEESMAIDSEVGND